VKVNDFCFCWCFDVDDWVVEWPPADNNLVPLLPVDCISYAKCPSNGSNDSESAMAVCCFKCFVCSYVVLPVGSKSVFVVGCRSCCYCWEPAMSRHEASHLYFALRCRKIIVIFAVSLIYTSHVAVWQPFPDKPKSSSVFWCCSFGFRRIIQCVKHCWPGYLFAERGANYIHMVWCHCCTFMSGFIKMQNGLAFWC